VCVSVCAGVFEKDEVFACVCVYVCVMWLGVCE